MKRLHLLCISLLLASPLCHADWPQPCSIPDNLLQPIPDCLNLYPEGSPQRTFADGAINPRIARKLSYDENGLSFVLTDKGYFYVSRKLKVRSAFTFDNGPDYFEQGLARTWQNGKIGFFNKSLKIVIPATHTFVFPFKNGRADACDGCIKEGSEHSSMTGGKWGQIDRKGRYTPQKNNPAE